MSGSVQVNEAKLAVAIDGWPAPQRAALRLAGGNFRRATYPLMAAPLVVPAVGHATGAGWLATWPITVGILTVAVIGHLAVLYGLEARAAALHAFAVLAGSSRAQVAAVASTAGSLRRLNGLGRALPAPAIRNVAHR